MRLGPHPSPAQPHNRTARTCAAMSAERACGLADVAYPLTSPQDATPPNDGQHHRRTSRPTPNGRLKTKRPADFDCIWLGCDGLVQASQPIGRHQAVRPAIGANRVERGVGPHSRHPGLRGRKRPITRSVLIVACADPDQRAEAAADGGRRSIAQSRYGAGMLSRSERSWSVSCRCSLQAP